MTTTNPYKFLHHIVFINLEKRTDRLAEINAEMAKMGLVAERFNAISRSIGNIGAHMAKDKNLIIDIDPDEADHLIQLIENLIEIGIFHAKNEDKT